MAQTSGMIDRIGAMQDFKLYRELHWDGSFEDYLALVRERPQVTSNAYQRLLKQGSEYYSRTQDAALYSFDWTNLAGTDLAGTSTDRFASPMNDEPLRLIPMDWRDKAIAELALSNEQYRVHVDGDLDPAS